MRSQDIQTNTPLRTVLCPELLAQRQPHKQTEKHARSLEHSVLVQSVSRLRAATAPDAGGITPGHVIRAVCMRVCVRAWVLCKRERERERERERARARARERERERERGREREAELGETQRERDSLVIIKNYSNRSFFDGYCSTVHWFEVDLGFTKLVFFRLICELSVFSSHEIHE